MNVIMVFGAFLFSIVFSFIFVWIPIWIFRRNREPLSRWMDRTRLRPSLVHGLFALVLGFLGLSFLLIAPFRILSISSFNSVITVIGVLGVAGWIGFGFDRIVHKPKVEYRPQWYLGEGDPSWQESPTHRAKQTVSLTWIIVSTLVCCIIFARCAVLFQRHRHEEQQRSQAVQAALDLGATIKDGSVSFGGMSHIGDDDLTFLQDLVGIDDLNLSQTSISNESLKRVAKIETLVSLFLTDTNIDDDGLQHLVGHFPRLHALFLENTQATGNVLPLPKLEHRFAALKMSGCPVDAAGLTNIVAVTQGASYLELNDTSIDDSMLDILKSAEVTQLMLQRTNLSRAGRDALRDSLPPKRRSLLNWSPKRPKVKASLSFQEAEI